MFKLSLGGEAWLEKVEIRHADTFLRVTTPIREDIGRYFAVKETAEEFRAWIAEYRDMDAQDAGMACGVWDAGELVGMIAILEISRHYLSCSLACWMVPDARGRGLAARATRAITSYAFDALSLERVVIRVATENFVSQRIPERLGFRCEGVARSAEVIGDRFLDVVIYAMLAGEWAEACERADRCPVRSAAPTEVAWAEDLPRLSLAGGPAAEILVVPGQAAVGLTGGRIVWLAGTSEEAHRALLARVEGDLRRRRERLLRATLRPDAPEQDALALEALGFFALGGGSWGRTITDLGL